MSKLLDMSQIFHERHNFDDEDLQLLKERWPTVEFENIPNAWIIPIDEMLFRLRYNNPIIKITQYYGQPVIYHSELNDKQRRIIKRAEQDLKQIDEDLNMEFVNV